MDVCPVCKTPYSSDSSKFCSHCGAPRPKPVACQNCGATLAPNALFCDRCGTRTAFGEKVDKALGK